MKKLFTLLIAATSFATATELQEIAKTITWNVTEAGMQADLPQSFTESMEISVVVTLNWQEIKVLYDTYKDASLEFFTISGNYGGTSSPNNHTQYVGSGFLVSSSSNDCIIGGFGGTDKKSYQSVHSTTIDFNKEGSQITYATLVFTMNATSDNRRMYLQLWNEDYDIIPFNKAPKPATGPEFLTSLRGINYNPSYVNSIQIYSGIIPENLAQDYAYNLLTIPEPTTTTLSLLALSVLVARRRR